jgi:CHAT domain-containing protein/tetratricopeptide (TPR) repeat protein
MVEILSPVPVRLTVAVSFGLGLAHYKLRKFPPAIKHFVKMEELAYSDNTQVGSVYLSLYYRGEISFNKQRYTEAADLFHKSVSVYSGNTVAVRYKITPPSKSVVYAKEGASFRHGQRILEAVRAYKNAISVAESKRDKLSACTSLGNMYQSLGENVLALEQYETTIKLAKELGDHVSLGWAHGNMGNAYLGLQQKDKALHHLKEALELAVTYETTPQAIGRTYNNLGTAYQSLNDLDRAEEYYDLALSQAVYGNDVGGQARVYGNFGNVLMLKKEYDRAIVHYTEAHNLSNDKATKTTALHNRGCASYEKGESSKKKYFTREGVRASDITYDGRIMKDSRHHRPELPESVLKTYRNGHKDLAKVIQRHEESFQTIKGSTHGLTLSVSLFESNSRTFHRVQDCLYNLGEFEKALEFAEQSRTRSLGELMFERCGKYQQNPLCSPMDIDQIFTIIKSLKSEKVDVVYISYTGARIIVWVISPINSHVEINLFQVSLQDDQFEGKSLDYFLRYSLNELLIENHVELYSFCDYNTASEAKYLSTLNDIFGKPLLTILEAVRGRRSIYDIILITDSYTHLMPVPTLFDTLSHQFLGDRLRVRYMPSLLTMGIMVKMPKVIVEVSEESQKFCIVGNPTIPTFQYQGESWRLGKLPFATKEAEWVAHILKTTPTLHEQATKMIILSMINSAKIVHLATHGSATAGFLAFAGLGSSRTREVTDEKTVLLYPEEVEKLHISPALVVLSSCDSGRGTVKADGIQGMARAFILAGAQSVLTTMWRIHDESASTFMKFFYQYLMDGFRSSIALHKASLSVRCFAKYSHFVHWSGYQLTGREIQLNVHMSSKDRAVLSKVGLTPSFPRLDVVKKLETAFLKDPVTPTDVQVSSYLVLHDPASLLPHLLFIG